MDLTTLLVALLGAGVLGYAKDAFAAYRRRTHAGSPAALETIHVNLADQSLLVVVRARDELEADNTRLRVTLDEERARAASDRAEAVRVRAADRAEIEALETKVRDILRELATIKHRREREMR